MKEIEEMLESYNNMMVKPSFFTGLDNETNKLNPEIWLEQYKKNTEMTIFNPDIFKNYIQLQIDQVKLYVNTENVINKLIDDVRLISKIKFCIDESYRNNRIAFYYNTKLNKETGEEEMWLRTDISYNDPDNLMSDDIKIDPCKIIDWLYDNYETIFVQFVSSDNDYESYNIDDYIKSSRVSE